MRRYNNASIQNVFYFGVHGSWFPEFKCATETQRHREKTTEETFYLEISVFFSLYLCVSASLWRIQLIQYFPSLVSKCVGLSRLSLPLETQSAIHSIICSALTAGLLNI